MNGPGEDTDIIPGLRPSDTAPLPLELPPHRGRHRRRMSRAALVAAWGAPTAVVALLVGHSLPGLFGSGEPRLVPPAVSEEPVAVEPPVPSSWSPSARPSRTRADRRRSRTPSPSPATATPSPRETPSLAATSRLPSAPTPSLTPAPSEAPTTSPSTSGTPTTSPSTSPKASPS